MNRAAGTGLYLALSLFTTLTTASASTLTFEYSGAVTQVPVDEIFGNISVGDLVRGTYTFDTAAVDLAPGAATGSYAWSAPYGMTAIIGSHTFEAQGLLSIGVLSGPVGQYTVFGSTLSGNLALELFLQDSSGRALSGDQLPLTAPDLKQFDVSAFRLHAMFPDGEVQVDGTLVSLTGVTAVPEPLSMAAVGSGLLFVLLLRRFHRRTHSR